MIDEDTLFCYIGAITQQGIECNSITSVSSLTVSLVETWAASFMDLLTWRIDHLAIELQKVKASCTNNPP